ncbi:MAG TPA: ABC transporter permease [Stenotrophomonas sp.]|nr:ABC transporter permease [Stenotrophomonas sp.]
MLGADPFLASLHRHRLAAGLIALQAALSTILLVLALAGASDIRRRIAQPSGLDEARLLRVVVGGKTNTQAQVLEQARLAQLPGVSSVVRINQVPFGGEAWAASFGSLPGTAAGTVQGTMYLGDIDLRERLALPLRQGRDFHAGEYVQNVYAFHHVLLSEPLAARLFPQGHPVGHNIFMGKRPLRVVGVYAALQGATPEEADSLIVPVRFGAGKAHTYLLRLAASQRPPAERVSAAIQGAGTTRWLADLRSVAELRQAYFARDRWIAFGLLAGVGLWLLGTGVGLANLADLLLHARLRQIGLCRALGARSGQIRWQLRREHLLLTGAGALAGLALLHLLLRAWPWLGMQLHTGSPALQLFAIVLVVATGQCAMWPITREADAVSPTGVLRHA